MVVRVCHQLAGALVGRTLTRAELRVPAYASARLAGATVTEVAPRASS